MTDLHAVRGMKDILPEEAKHWQWIENQARYVFERFGYQEIRTPLLEKTEVFSRGIGDTTDIVEKEMYTLEDSKGSYISLRPEMTASVARAYVEHHLDQSNDVCRLFYIGPMFRHERPQAGRLRQFHQMGVELIGLDQPMADADVICLVCSLLDTLGIKGYQLRLNSLGSVDTKKEYSQALRNYLQDKVSNLCPLCQARFQRNVFRILDCKEEHCSEISSQAPSLLDWHSELDKNYFEKVQFYLTQLKIPFDVDPRMVRGLDYYTRTVFEISHSGLGAKDALGAGGRYDNLIHLIGGKSTGAVGFAIGIERLLMVLNLVDAMSEQKSVYLVVLGETAMLKGYHLLQELRREDISSELNMSGKSLKSQLRQADKKNAAWTLICGEDEVKQSVMTVKNMKNGESHTISDKDIMSFLKQNLK